VDRDAGRPESPARPALTPPRKHTGALHAAQQPPGTDCEIRLEAGERVSSEASTFHRGLGRPRRGEGRRRVVDAMLQCLGDLDPRHDRVGPAAVRQVAPRLERLVVATEPPEEAGAIGDDSLPIDADGRR
jgi:hypothetical protein